MKSINLKIEGLDQEESTENLFDSLREYVQDISTADITSIHKKENKLNCYKYRGISAKITISGVKVRIIKNLFQKEYKNYREDGTMWFLC